MVKLLCGSAVSRWLSQLTVFVDLGHVLRNERTEIPRSCVSVFVILRHALVKCSDILEGSTASIFRVTELYLSYKHVAQNDLEGLPSCHL